MHSPRERCYDNHAAIGEAALRVISTSRRGVNAFAASCSVQPQHSTTVGTCVRGMPATNTPLALLRSDEKTQLRPVPQPNATDQEFQSITSPRFDSVHFCWCFYRKGWCLYGVARPHRGQDVMGNCAVMFRLICGVYLDIGSKSDHEGVHARPGQETSTRTAFHGFVVP